MPERISEEEGRANADEGRKERLMGHERGEEEEGKGKTLPLPT
jgi:hypothetical protein